MTPSTGGGGCGTGNGIGVGRLVAGWAQGVPEAVLFGMHTGMAGLTIGGATIGGAVLIACAKASPVHDVAATATRRQKPNRIFSLANQSRLACGTTQNAATRDRSLPRFTAAGIPTDPANKCAYRRSRPSGL